jgi:hypothetical protein
MFIKTKTVHGVGLVENTQEVIRQHPHTSVSIISCKKGWGVTYIINTEFQAIGFKYGVIVAYGILFRFY